MRFFGTSARYLNHPLTGIATNSCIVCTTHDGKMRDLKVTVAGDCCAASSSPTPLPGSGAHESHGLTILRSDSLTF